jgi:ABC-type glycerol-3-phosphate transport system substrate-binding protein
MLPGVGTYLKPAGPKMLVQPVGAVAMTVKADSPYKDKAMDLMYFLNDKDYYKDYWPKSQWGPTLENQYDNPAFEQSWLKVRVDLAKSGKPSAWPDIQTPAWAEMNNAFVIPRMLQAVVSDNKKPEDAFQAAADEIDKIYKKYENS